jgi:type II secretory pathway pseudopilin PulG
MTLLEVTIALALVVMLLVSTSAAFSSSVTAVHRARRVARATLFLETVMEDVKAQAYDDLLALDGSQFFDGPDPATANCSVTLTVFVAQVDLLQVRARLVDTRTGEVIGDVVTLRSDR